MNAAQIHLAINHFPVVLSAVSFVFLALGFFRRNELISRMGLALVIVSGLISIPVYLSGEPAESVLEGISGGLRSYIHEHEESAEVAFVLTEVTAAVALLALYITKKRPELARKVLSLLMILSLLVFAKFAQVAHQGGVIRHSEIRSDSTANSHDASSDQSTSGASDAGQLDDDDGEYDVSQDPGHGEV